MAADRLEKTRELLLQAVESLRDSTSSPPPPAPERNSAPPNARQVSGCSERTSVIGEHNRLFNFDFLNKLGTGGGKSTSHGVKMPKSKKKRLNSCNHDFVCLASTTQSKPPTSFEAANPLSSPSTNVFQKTEVEESITLTDHARSFATSRRLAGIRWHGIPLRGRRWWTGSGVS